MYTYIAAYQLLSANFTQSNYIYTCSYMSAVNMHAPILAFELHNHSIPKSAEYTQTHTHVNDRRDNKLGAKVQIVLVKLPGFVQEI